MKKALLTLFFAAAGLCTAAQELTVASYNIRYRNPADSLAGNGWEQRRPWVASLIEFLDPDIFGAQEVLHAQLGDLLTSLPDYAYLGVGRVDGKTAGEYAPIFYKRDRFRLLDGGHFWLSTTPDRPSVGWDAALERICTWGHFADRQTGRTLWFFNLHLDHVGVEARAKSVELVLERIRTLCSADDAGVILTGDFNVDQHNAAYGILTGSPLLCDTYEAAERRYAPNGTFNAYDPSLKTDSRIDHIFVSPAFRIRNYGVLTETYRAETAASREQVQAGDFPKEVSFRPHEARLPSDHFPVVVKLDFPK